VVTTNAAQRNPKSKLRRCDDEDTEIVQYATTDKVVRCADLLGPKSCGAATFSIRMDGQTDSASESKEKNCQQPEER